MKKGGAQHKVQPHSDLQLVFENTENISLLTRITHFCSFSAINIAVGLYVHESQRRKQNKKMHFENTPLELVYTFSLLF